MHMFSRHGYIFTKLKLFAVDVYIHFKTYIITKLILFAIDINKCFKIYLYIFMNFALSVVDIIYN